jgi:hypothetical protein
MDLMQGKRKGLIVVAALVLALTLALASAATAAPVQENGDGVSAFCPGGELEDMVHPVATAIADTYEVEVDPETEQTEEDVVEGWFCEGFGFGQIMLALQTADMSDEATAEELLGRRDEGEGWGQIWQELELIGRPEDAGPPFEVPPGKDGEPGPPFEEPPGKDGEPGPPEHAGSPHDSVPPGHANGPSNDNAKGPPDHAGQPGPPDDAAPSGNANGNSNGPQNENGQQKGRGGP